MKKLISICAGLVLAFSMSACGNQTLFDTTYTFDKVQIRMMDGSVVDGEVKSWTDFENGDMLQVTVNGKTYLTHSSNVVLIDE